MGWRVTAAYSSTEVDVSRSQEGIRKTLRTFGVMQITFGEGGHETDLWAGIEFLHEQHLVRMRVAYKAPDAASIRAKAQRARTKTARDIELEALEQEVRRIWRVLFHTLKARMVAVEEDVETFEQAFLPHLVDPVSGRTVWDELRGAVAAGALDLGGGGLARAWAEAQAALPRALPAGDDDVLDAELVPPGGAE